MLNTTKAVECMKEARKRKIWNVRRLPRKVTSVLDVETGKLTKKRREHLRQRQKHIPETNQYAF